MNNSPVISKDVFQFEVKVWNEGEPKIFENILPTLVICANDEPFTAYGDYMQFLLDENVDTSKIKEIRVNRKGGSQGYYFTPNPLRWG